MGRSGIAGGIDSMTEQVKKRTGVFGMKTKDCYFRPRGMHPIEKTAPAHALAERNIDEYKLDLSAGKAENTRSASSTVRLKCIEKSRASNCLAIGDEDSTD